MSGKSKYVIVLAVISALMPLPGAFLNLCGYSFETLLPFASVPILILIFMFIVCSPISLCMILHAAVLKQWKDVVLLVISLFFRFLTFIVIGLVNKPGYEAVMSV